MAKKFKNPMFKRICVVALIVSVVSSLLIIPASAVSSGSGAVRYSILPFDEVCFGTNFNDRQPWPSNDIRLGNIFYAITEGPFAGFDLTWGANQLHTVVYTNAGNRAMRLIGSNHIVDMNALRVSNSISVDFGTDGDLSGDVDFYVEGVAYELVAGNYTPVSFRVQGICQKVANSWGNIGTEIANAISAETSARYVYLTFYFLELRCTYDEFDGKFNINIRGSNTYPTFYAWANQFNMTHETIIQVDPADPSDVSFVDWIGVAVGGFFDFELWPGMTLGEIIEFILVFGLVFWFLTMVI